MKSSLAALLVSLTFLAALASPARAQCPTWAAGFTPGGLNGTVNTLAVYDDGAGPKLYAGGLFDQASGAPSGHVARWNGASWEALSGTLTGRVEALATYDDGSGPKLYAGGSNLLPGVNLAAWDGTSWSALPNGPNGPVMSLAVFDGWLYLGGSFSYVNAVWTPCIARWNGSIWAGIGGALGVSVDALAVHDDGSGPALYVGGHFNYAGGLPVSSIARWDGSHWSTLGSGPQANGPISALAVHDFGSGPVLVAGGGFGSIGGISSTFAARWDGSAWSALPGLAGSSGSSGVRALVSAGAGPSADLYAGGVFAADGGSSPGNVARWNGSAWTAVGTGLQAGTTDSVEALASFDDGAGTRLFAGGAIQAAGSVHIENVARWDGATWSPAGSNHHIAGSNVQAITHYDDGTGDALYVAGDFIGAGDVAARSIARWNGSSWSSIGDVAGTISALCVFDDGTGPQLYAGGSFTSIGGVSARCIARWNGSTWSQLPHLPVIQPTALSTVMALIVHDDGSGPSLFVGGDLQLPGVDNQIALRWRNAAWSAVGSETHSCGLTGFVSGFAVHDDGSGPALYACGYGMQLDCVAYEGVAKWDGTSWSNLGQGLTNNGGWCVCHAIVSHDDGSGPALYVGGLFTEAGGAPARCIARWKNGVWEPLGNGVFPHVRALSSFDAGDGGGPALYVGGDFSSPGSSTPSRLQRWSDGNWSDVAGGIGAGGPTGATVLALCAWNDGGGRRLYVGGSFALADTQFVHAFARLDACSETGQTFCFGDGSATACPCGNASAVGDRAGCLHSLGYGGKVRARGEPQLSNDTLVLDGTQMTNSSALFVQGATLSNAGAGVVFGDGIKCANSPFVRLGTTTNVGGASSNPGVGELPLSVRGHVTTPGTRYYQIRYRNAVSFCTPDTFNYTNGVGIVWRL